MCGYEELIKVMVDDTHEEHEEMLEWLGLNDASAFKPAAFSIEEVNQRIAH